MVLFRPRPDLSMEDRRALIAALATALEEIPSIRRASVGRRVRIDRPYEQLTRIDLPYAAILEFDDVGGLRAYLDHPAHEDIANRFFAALAETLIYDFEMEAGAEGLRGLLASEPC
jgi:hypothetical protein